MGSWEDVKKNTRDRATKGPAIKVPYKGDANSRAIAAKERDEAARPGRIEANRIARETEANRRYNENKGDREAAARAAARASADRLKPPAPPAAPATSSAKKSAVTRMIEGFKGGAGKGGRIGGLGSLRGGGAGYPRVR